jgi:hypothetical protein
VSSESLLLPPFVAFETFTFAEAAPSCFIPAPVTREKGTTSIVSIFPTALLHPEQGIAIQAD